MFPRCFCIGGFLLVRKKLCCQRQCYYCPSVATLHLSFCSLLSNSVAVYPDTEIVEVEGSHSSSVGSLLSNPPRSFYFMVPSGGGDEVYNQFSSVLYFSLFEQYLFFQTLPKSKGCVLVASPNQEVGRGLPKNKKDLLHQVSPLFIQPSIVEICFIRYLFR